MLTFSLAISYLTTSNLPWFMDLTFQVPMQYCSLQHQTLLLSPVTSTTGCCFCFGSIPSFFLEFFLHWFPLAYWARTDLGSSSFSVLSFCLFMLFMSAWRTMDRGSWHCIGDRNQDHLQKKEMQKSKTAVREALQIAVKEEKWKTKEKRKDIPIWMQNLKDLCKKKARRDKKAFLSDKCKKKKKKNGGKQKNGKD